jgi:hypothetical protein
MMQLKKGDIVFVKPGEASIEAMVEYSIHEEAARAMAGTFVTVYNTYSLVSPPDVRIQTDQDIVRGRYWWVPSECLETDPFRIAALKARMEVNK